MSADQSKPVVAIVGPTASGKSELGIEVALRLQGEIINCDSVQVYQGIRIATAKVPIAERRGVPHHLIDFVSPNINYTAGEWAREAVTVIADIQRRERLPILVGGTGLYLRAFRNPFFKSPATDEALRRRLNELRERRGAEHLHRLLQRIDPQSAIELYPRDWPRVQRAIEVRLQTGRAMSDQKSTRPQPPESARPAATDCAESTPGPFTNVSTNVPKNTLPPVWWRRSRRCWARACRQLRMRLAHTVTAGLSSFFKENAISRVRWSKHNSTCVTTPNGNSPGSGANPAPSGLLALARINPSRQPCWSR